MLPLSWIIWVVIVIKTLTQVAGENRDGAIRTYQLIFYHLLCATVFLLLLPSLSLSFSLYWSDMSIYPNQNNNRTLELTRPLLCHQVTCLCVQYMCVTHKEIFHWQNDLFLPLLITRQQLYSPWSKTRNVLIATLFLFYLAIVSYENSCETESQKCISCHFYSPQCDLISLKCDFVISHIWGQ